MRDDKELIDDLNDIENLTELISAFEGILKKKMIEVIKGEMAWARLRYDEGGTDYAERIEFADFYFKLNDILEELYRDRVSGVVGLQLEVERAYSELRSSVSI